MSSHPSSGSVAAGTSVSVIIPCHNQAQFLASSIESAFVAGASEVIVVDDGSTDDTARVALSFSEVRYVHRENRGVAAARNSGLRHARGEFVLFLDADDCLLPGAVEAGAAALAAHPECAMVFGRCVMMASDGRFMVTPEQPRIEHDHHAALLRRNLIWMPAMAMFRREAVARAGGFVMGFDAAADYDLYLRLAACERIHDHAHLVAGYRRHDGNMSANAARMLRETDVVMQRNRPSEPRLDAAWQEGCRLWRSFYGTQLVEEIRRHLRCGERLKAIRKALTLVRWTPALALGELGRKVQLHLPARWWVRRGEATRHVSGA